MPSPEASRQNGKRGGRPPGEPTKLARKLAEELTAAGCTPVDVMLDNMNFWLNEGMKLEEWLRSLLEQELPEARKREIRKLIKSIDARERAYQCAKDVAPYMHPKFR